jgi:hypothetical protein
MTSDPTDPNNHQNELASKLAAIERATDESKRTSQVEEALQYVDDNARKRILNTALSRLNSTLRCA